MSDADRIQRWRQRMRDEGKEPLSLWLSRDTKLRLEDLASVWHCSPSELVEQALAQFHLGNPSVPGTVADTEQLQTLLGEAARALLPTLKREILHELQLAHTPSPPVLDTNRNVTDTSPQEPPTAPGPVHVYTPEHGHSLLTESTPQPSVRTQPRKYGEIPAAVLAILAHQQPATAGAIARARGDGSKQGIKAVYQALQRLADSGKVRKQGKQYQLVS